MSHPNAIPPEDLIPSNQMAETYPHIFTRPEQADWLLRNRDNNGLNHAVIKIGKRLFLSKSRFSEFLASQANQEVHR